MDIKLSHINKYLNDNYPALGAIKNIELLTHNNINSTNYLVAMENEKYVLRNFTDGSKPEKMEQICRILIFCLKNQANVVQPIRNKDNYYVDKKRKMYLTRYYEGGLYNGTTHGLKDAAINLAILHLALSKAPIRYNYRGNHNYYKHLTQPELKRIETIISLKKEKDIVDKKVLENLDYLSKSFSGNAKITGILKKTGSKKQLIHHDFHPGNVILSQNRVAAILDFNAMRKGETIEDVAFASFRFSSYETNNIHEIKERIKVFVDTYLLFNDINRQQLTYSDYYFIRETLSRLSFILKKRYFANSNLWSTDFNKQVHLLKMAKKSSPFYEKC